MFGIKELFCTTMEIQMHVKSCIRHVTSLCFLCTCTRTFPRLEPLWRWSPRSSRPRGSEVYNRTLKFLFSFKIIFFYILIYLEYVRRDKIFYSFLWFICFADQIRKYYSLRSKRSETKSFFFVFATQCCYCRDLQNISIFCRLLKIQKVC